jgi:hypothetical protein
VLPDVNTTGILIPASSISIDLNGFEIIGAACVGALRGTCLPGQGDGSGVRFDREDYRFGVSVSNGSITGMGSDGVNLGAQSVVTGLRVGWNHSNGIVVESDSTVSRSKFLNGSA